MMKPQLGGWLPDACQPNANAANDYQFAENVHKVEAAAYKMPFVVYEENGVLDLRRWCSPVENQSSIGSCVGNGTVGALEFLLIRDGLPYVDLSRLFAYYNARLQVQEQETDAGAYIRIAFGTLSSLGTCSENKWPYDISKVFVRPSWGAYREAFANKINEYYSIGGVGQIRIDFIKRALQSQHVVVFGMTVDDDFVAHRGSQPVPMPKSVRAGAGGHCMLIAGYDENKRCWIVRNSWGTTWGDKGYALIPFSYLDESNANDFWCATSFKFNSQ